MMRSDTSNVAQPIHKGVRGSRCFSGGAGGGACFTGDASHIAARPAEAGNERDHVLRARGQPLARMPRADFGGRW